MTSKVAESRDIEFSLLEDPLLRLQRVLRLASPQGFNAPRRAAILVMGTWLPIMIWAAASGNLQMSLLGDSIMRHLGVHVRCLLIIPLFILSEPLADRVMRLIVANFAPSGLIRPEDRQEFAAVLRSVERWRDSKAVWAGIVALVAALALAERGPVLADPDALSWVGTAGSLDFGGVWTRYVVIPLCFLLLFAWLWRLALTWILFRRLSRLDLRLVPSHPDGVGGLDFIKLHSIAFSLVVPGIMCLASTAVAHQMLIHGAHFKDFQIQLISLVILLTALFVGPLTAFSSKLRKCGERAKFQYGTLAGRHLRAVHERWIEGRTTEDDAVLSAPEIGPAADMATLYQLGTQMRMAPIGKFQVVALLVPAALPVLAVLCLEVPLADILRKIFGLLS